MFLNKEKLENLKLKKLNCFSLELLPRITRAQSMDILSSQANLLVIKQWWKLSKFMKGYSNDDSRNYSSSKSISCWSGVAELQTIATAKRMGAVVFAANVRMASKEQVGKFLMLKDQRI